MSAASMFGVTPKLKQKFASKAAADLFVAQYLKTWHPLGYGTMCYTDEHADGSCTVRCYRGDSCE